MKGGNKMKKRFIRHNFNMVEIMLAVIVIALGITGTFVLFPVGVNANKSAVADNSIADIAEYVTSFVRAEILAGSRGNSGKKGFDPDSNEFKKLFNTDGATPDSDKYYYKGLDVDTVSSDWEVPDTHSGRKSGTEKNEDISMLLRRKSEDEDTGGVYLVRQVSGPEGKRFVDFAAVARVYLDNGDDDGTGLTDACFPTANAVMSPGSSDEKDELKKFFLPAVLELSWPASAPIAEREKRYFRFEIFNDHYRVAE